MEVKMDITNASKTVVQPVCWLYFLRKAHNSLFNSHFNFHFYSLFNSHFNFHFYSLFNSLFNFHFYSLFNSLFNSYL